jgi:hypothetical protein
MKKWSSMREIFRSFVVLVLAVSFVGCKSDPYGPTGKVTGKLTLDGKQLPAGHAVSFMQMEKGFLAYGITDSESNFEIKSWNDGKMPVGSYNVMIAPPGGEGDTSTMSAEDRFEQGQATGKSKTLFPARYRETTTSGLRYDIVEGKNHFDIDLKPK